MKTILITCDIVKNTKYYKSMSKIQKSLTKNRNSIKAISNGFNICRNIGFEKWDAISNSNWNNKQIIKELLENESINIHRQD